MLNRAVTFLYSFLEVQFKTLKSLLKNARDRHFSLSSARNCPTWRWPQGRGWCFDQRGCTPLVYKGV
jgi:hypothetical protein